MGEFLSVKISSFSIQEGDELIKQLLQDLSAVSKKENITDSQLMEHFNKQIEGLKQSGNSFITQFLSKHEKWTKMGEWWFWMDRSDDRSEVAM